MSITKEGPMFTMWAEWDLGQERFLFRDAEEAMRYLQELVDCGYLDEDVNEIWEDNLVGLDRVEFYYK